MSKFKAGVSNTIFEVWPNWISVKMWSSGHCSYITIACWHTAAWISLLFYRDSFGENEEGGLLSLQEQPPSGAQSVDRPSSSATLIATTPSSSSNSSVILQTTRDATFVSSQTRRKNYIIFEQNDEDTLI